MKLKNNDGLWTDEETGACVGYLMDFTGKGVFSPDGKVDITPEQAKTHNDLLSQGEIKGLDENCQVGMQGTFYYIKGQVQTFMGAVVSADVSVNGQSITFRRNGRVFRGRLQRDADCFNFRRIS
jgi:hypothetical protein